MFLSSDQALFQAFGNVLSEVIKLAQQGLIGPTTSHEQIEKKAYELWEQAGRPEGRSNEFWDQAVNELKA